MFKAEFVDWIPEFDNKTAFNALSDYNKCNDDRNARTTNNGFWHKITSIIKKKELYPLTSIMREDKEKYVRSRNTYVMAWNQTYYE